MEDRPWRCAALAERIVERVVQRSGFSATAWSGSTASTSCEHRGEREQGGANQKPGRPPRGPCAKKVYKIRHSAPAFWRCPQDVAPRRRQLSQSLPP